MECFKKGFDLCKHKLGMDHELTRALKNSYGNLRKETFSSAKSSGQASSVQSHKADTPRAVSAYKRRSQSQEPHKLVNKRQLKVTIKDAKIANRHLLPHVEAIPKTPIRSATRSPPKARKVIKKIGPIINYDSKSPKQVEMNVLRQKLPKFDEIRNKTPTPNKINRIRIDAKKHHQQENLAASIIQL